MQKPFLKKALLARAGLPVPGPKNAGRTLTRKDAAWYNKVCGFPAGSGGGIFLPGFREQASVAKAFPLYTFCKKVKNGLDFDAA